MENTPLLNKNIIVKSHKVESGVSKSGVKWTRIDITSEIGGKDIRFSFFPKKKDGTDTKAYEYYKKNSPAWTLKVVEGLPIEVAIAYSEEEYEYKDNKGQKKTGKRRNIKMFQDIVDSVKQDPEYAGMQELPIKKTEEEDIPIIESDEEMFDVKDIPF